MAAGGSVIDPAVVDELEHLAADTIRELWETEDLGRVRLPLAATPSPPLSVPFIQNGSG